MPTPEVISRSAQSQCTKCGEAYARKTTSASLQCNPCRAAANRQWRAARRAAGLPYYDREKAKARVGGSYKYNPSPEAKARIAAYQARHDREDPVRREKQAIRKATRQAVARGDLVRGPCEVCGSSDVEGHHDDYSKPLEVRWLCRTHHREHHSAQRRAAA